MTTSIGITSRATVDDIVDSHITHTRQTITVTHIGTRPLARAAVMVVGISASSVRAGHAGAVAVMGLVAIVLVVALMSECLVVRRGASAAPGAAAAAGSTRVCAAAVDGAGGGLGAAVVIIHIVVIDGCQTTDSRNAAIVVISR